MNCTPKVSIIVPCYKQAEYLSETLDSVLAQTYPDWECVIVNDGSPDNTEEIASQYLEKDRRYKYVSQDNKGLATARNVGIAHSQGEFILPLDADDLIESTYLEKAVNRFACFPNTKLVYCKAERFGQEQGYWDLPSYHYEDFIWKNCIFCTALFRRSDFDTTDGYNANMIHGLEDWDFWLSLLKKDDVVHRIDEVLFYYRVKDASMVTMLSGNYLKNSLLQIYKNHPNIYYTYMDRLVLYHYESLQLEELMRENEGLRKEIVRIRGSYAFRLGKTLLKPFSWVKKRIGQ